MLARAREKMEEQDDEIKKLNELILNAKCHAIRDAQLSEKAEIAKAMKEEEVRKGVGEGTNGGTCTCTHCVSC